MTKQPHDEGWRNWVLGSLPKMQASSMATEPATGGFTQATSADFGPVIFRGDRTPDDPAELLDGLPLVKCIAIKQRALDLHGSIPSFEAIREVQLEKISHANRISELVKPRGDGGPNLPEDAPQVATVRKQMLRAEQELARLQAPARNQDRQMECCRTVVARHHRLVAAWRGSAWLRARTRRGPAAQRTFGETAFRIAIAAS